jgi:DNA polymerase I-like protein with 3'-5' exonuclease and polymerase domains
MGGLATRAILDLPKKKNITVKMFHGTVNRDPTNRFWVIPTFHPAFILKGSHKYTNVVISDLMLAKEIADNGFIPNVPKLVIDPDVGWFSNWVDEYEKRLAKNPGLWLSVDIETPEKEADEDELEIGRFTSADITRINFSCDPNEGITVPFEGPYLAIINRLLQLGGRRGLWNYAFDIPRLEAAGFLPNGECHDGMWMWHMLQSDLPLALGFVSTFYSNWHKAWKHLSDDSPGEYAAIDAVQTQRCVEGLEADLKKFGQWEIYKRHAYDIDRLCYAPAKKVGVLLDKERLLDLQGSLEEDRDGFEAEIRKVIPQEILPLEPSKGRKTAPKDNIEFFEKKVVQFTYDCKACGGLDLPEKHSCRKKGLEPDVQLIEREVSRWFKYGEFNPDSPKQVMRYIKFHGHKPGRAKGTSKETTNVDTIEKLAKSTKDPFYTNLGKLRRIGKVLGTYVGGFLDRMDEDGRVHPSYTHKPSTWRTASEDPNFQNVIKQHGEEDEFNLGSRFRSCIVAAAGCKLIELDLSAVEAVEVGWFAGDPTYIRLAKISIHSFLCSYIINEPADLSWPDDELTRYLKSVKKRFKIPYERSKRVIHGSNYLLSPKGMHLYYPTTFPTAKSAEEIQSMYFSVAPSIPVWQKSVQERAHRQKYLGGNDHPFRYRHHFYNVYSYTRISKREAETLEGMGKPVAEIRGRWYAVSLGSDGKRCVAYYPQSTTNGVLKEAMLKLFNPDHPSYIGDAYFGKTPLRAPIHDSLFFEVENKRVDEVLEKVVKEMTAPIVQQPCPKEWELGEYLTVGVEANIGTSWDKMFEVEI